MIPRLLPRQFPVPVLVGFRMTLQVVGELLLTLGKKVARH